jgi:hypothetical protein
MRPIAVLSVIAFLCLSAAAAPAVECGPDCIGIYFDQAAETWCLPDAVPFTPLTAYLILSAPTMEAISGMLILPLLDGPIMLTEWDFYDDIFVICDPVEPTAVCGFWDPPLATTPVTALAEITLLYLGGEPATIAVRNSPPTVDGRIWVALPDGSSAPLTPSTGAAELPMAQIGGVCQVVPTQASSWSAVKGLYR